MLLSSKVFIQTIDQGIRYRNVVLSSRVGIDRNPCKSIKLSVDIDRYTCDLPGIKLGNRHRSIYPCKPITLNNRYRWISSHTYRFNQQVLIGGDKKVLFERQPVGSHFQIMLVPKIPIDVAPLRKYIWGSYSEPKDNSSQGVYRSHNRLLWPLS